MKTSELKSIISFVALTYAISWVIWLAGIWSIPGLTGIHDPRFILFIVVGSFAPSISALIVTWMTGGKAAVKTLLKRLVQVKLNWKVYFATFFLLPIVAIATYTVLGITAKDSVWLIAATAVIGMPINALIAIFLGVGPLGEEMGWRGFLQDRLQGKYNTVVVAIIVGLIWALWHLPLGIAFADFRSGGLTIAQFLPIFTVSAILIAFVMGHLWRWSKGSLFIAIYFHAIVNKLLDDYLPDTSWWNLDNVTPLQMNLSYVLILAVTAVAIEVLSRTVFKKSNSVVAS